MLWDREAQQRSRARASVQDSGCGGSVIRSPCLFTLRTVPRCFSIEQRVCRNRLSWAAFTPNLTGGGQTNTDVLNEMIVNIYHVWSDFVSRTTLDHKSGVKLIYSLTVIAYHCCMCLIVTMLYLRCLLIVDATHRKSLMSGRGRHFIELWCFSFVDEVVSAPSTCCFSFCPRLVNHSTWSRSMMALSSCWSRFLRSIRKVQT